jgi:hypothetical protein
VALAAALVLPAFAGLLIVAGASRFVSPRYLAAFALGIFLWFFSDTMGDSAFLDVNSGFGGGAVQISLVFLFIFGVLLVFSLDRGTLRTTSGLAGGSFGVPLLVAFAVGMHGFGEGAAFTATAATTPASALLDAFGGTSAAAAFILHKALESMMVGAAYWAYAKGRVNASAGLLRDIIVLALVFVIPGIVGAATDYYLLYDTTYFFAFGLGTSLYAALTLAKPLYAEVGMSGWESAKLALLIIFGFLCLYFAALLHA